MANNLSITDRVIEAARQSKQPFASADMAKDLKIKFGTVNGTVSRLYYGKLMIGAKREYRDGSTRATTLWKRGRKFTLAEGRSAVRAYEEKARASRRAHKEARQTERMRQRIRPAAKHVANQMEHQENQDLVFMLLKRILPELRAITKALGA